MIVGVGIDIVEIAQLASGLLSRARMRGRVFTRREIAACDARASPAQHLAARFAAKEAAFKAVGTGWGQGVRWSDVETVTGANGKPSLVVRGALARHASALGGTTWTLSLTHGGDYAAAVVVLS